MESVPGSVLDLELLIVEQIDELNELIEDKVVLDQKLLHIKRNIDLLRKALLDLEVEAALGDVAQKDLFRRHDEEYKRLRKSLVELEFQVKVNIQKYETAQRQQLFEHLDSVSELNELKGKVASAQRATAAVSQARQMMSAETQRMLAAEREVAATSELIRRANGLHDDLSGSLDTGSKVITRLEKRQAIDKMMIYGAFIVFLVVVLYIVKARTWG